MDVVKMEGTIGTPGRGLPEVHREIVEKLIDDDWCRFSTADGRRTFYAIGYEVFLEYERQEEDFLNLELPETGQGSAEGEWFARSQVASTHPSYLDQHKRRFEEKTGVPLAEMADWFRRYASGEVTIQDLPQSKRMSPGRMIDLFAERLSSVAASLRQEGRVPEEDEENRRRIDVGREKHCLREICTLYGKMLGRLEQLDLLSFEDSPLQEASRCYLYGFLRACVVLSAAALETKLKHATGIDYCKDYWELVDKAEETHLLDNAHAEYARFVFSKRTPVVHRNANLDFEGAFNVLVGARKVMSFLAGWPR